MHNWGYAPTVSALASDLLGGGVSIPILLKSIERSEDVVVDAGFVFRTDHQHLVDKSRRRVETHRALNGAARRVALEFAEGLARVCPLIECIALSGSVASGGYESHDDIDIDLFVVDGAKYFAYATALLIGLKTSILHRKTYGLRKLICINVLWSRGESHPFCRKDENLAFELLHCQPLLGAQNFQDVVADNEWIDSFFPQIRERIVRETMRFPSPHAIGRIVAWVSQHRRLLKSMEASAKLLSQAAYSFAHWLRRKDAAALERLRFLQRVKYPYEVFQD